MLSALPAKTSPTASLAPLLALPITGNPAKLARLVQVDAYDAARILIDRISHKFSQQTLKAAPLQLSPFPCLQQKILFNRFGDNEGLNGIAVVKQDKLQGIN